MVEAESPRVKRHPDESQTESPITNRESVDSKSLKADLTPEETRQILEVIGILFLVLLLTILGLSLAVFSLSAMCSMR